MKWFGKKGKRIEVSDRFAAKIANFILKLQENFASRMSKATKELSTTSLKWLILIFILAGTTISIYIAASAVSKKQNPIAIKHLHLTVLQKQLDTGQIITKAEYGQLKKLERFVDSLHKIKSPAYDSILEFRPGLLDSVKLLHSFYQNQFSNQK
jgi:hypothetical protein